MREHQKWLKTKKKIGNLTLATERHKKKEVMENKREKKSKDDSVALAAVALQDHLVKSMGLGDFIGPRHIGLGPAARAKQKNVKDVRSRLNIGRFGRSKPVTQKKEDKREKEYVLDPKPSPMTLAQKMGLVDAPEQPLTETEWLKAKEKSNKRDDSKMPCVICKEDFGTQEQVLLSCTHVFHRACLQAFERFTGKKTCPMCRREQYQTRVIHEGSKQHRHKCATMIQSLWRGHVVRCMYRKLRESHPPKDPRLRKKFFEEKLHRITDRIVRSCDFDVNQFLRELDNNLEASRNVFRDFDARFKLISDEEWEKIQLKAVERANTDCPICLTSLVSRSYIETSTLPSQKEETCHTSASSRATKPSTRRKDNVTQSTKQNKQSTKDVKVSNQSKTEDQENQSCQRRTVLLSCSHVFHETCLNMFEELSMDSNSVCPVCRTKYQKRVIAM